MAGSVASSLLSSRLDYVDSILYGMSLKNINRLQRIHHSLARVVTHWRSHALPSATALLKQLHWLPIEWRIRFKLATVTFKALHTGGSPYLTHQLQYYQPPLPSNRHHRSCGDCLEGKGEIIRSVLCNIVCNNCAQCNAHTYEQT